MHQKRNLSVLKFSNFILIGLFLNVQTQISIISPQSLKNQIKFPNLEQGELIYNISMFGDVDYSEKREMEIILPQENNQYGCDNLFTPKLTSKKTHFGFLLKRGKCPFSKKAINAKLVGAAVIFIYFDYEADYKDFMEYFIYAPYYKEHMIPAILLDHEASLKIKRVLEDGTDQNGNQGIMIFILISKKFIWKDL